LETDILNDLSRHKIIKLHEDALKVIMDSTDSEKNNFMCGTIYGISKTLQYLGLHIENITQEKE